MAEKTNEEQSAASGIEPREGLIGFFDILGYQSFLNAHNTPVQATTKVLSTLLSLQRELPAEVIDIFSEGTSGKEYIEHVKALEWLVFSDTIVIVTETSGLTDPDVRVGMFLYQCAMLQRRLFDFGMPVRGCIESGQFYVAQTCFAGTPFVRAYECVGQLECAACVVPSEVEQFIERLGESSLNEIGGLPEYRVPLKDNYYKSYKILPPLYSVHAEGGWKNLDLRQLVLNSFWGHGKQMTGTAVSKADNTERLFRFLKSKEPDFN